MLSGRFLSASGPLWFAVALLVFSIVYAVARLVADLVRGRRLEAAGSRPRTITTRAINIAVACLIAIIALGAFLLRLVQPLGTSVMNMQLGYFSSYIVLFVAGLWAGRNGLLAQIPAKVGRTWLWVSIGVGLPVWMILQGLGGALEGKAGPLQWRLALAGGRHRDLGILLLRRLQPRPAHRVLRPGEHEEPLTGLLSHTGFGVYTFHAPILVGVSMLLLTVTLHPLAKALIVASLAWVASTAFAWVVRKIPGVGRIFA